MHACRINRHWLYQVETSRIKTVQIVSFVKNGLYIGFAKAEYTYVYKFLSETKYLLMFLLALTTATAFSIADTEVDSHVTYSPAELIRAESVATASKVESKRRPSSLSEVKNELVSVTLPCTDDAKKIQKNSRDQLIMLNLNLCETDKAAQSVSMTNKTNGFKAQIFKMSAKNFRTDFIQLNKGLNILEIESILKDGQKHVQTLEMLSGS